MVDTGTALIVSSFIGSMFMMLILMLNNRNWFNRENFKINIAAEKLKLKKLAKDMNLQPPPMKTETGILELLKGLDKDKIAGILEMLQGGNEETDLENEGIEGTLINFAKNNPDLVKNLISGLGSAGANIGSQKIPIENR